MSCTGACHGHINFTTRGKLLLIDVEKAKRDEFNRRRKLRLQQVRQQSSEIAKEIRDRVKAEKVLKYSKEELRKQAQFDRWKQIQLKNLQDDFNRRVMVSEQEKENALKEGELEELEKERQQVLDEIAKKRGDLAVLRQRKQKLNVETENFLKSSNAKFNRSLENLRSALISSLPKPEEKKSSIEQKIQPERRQVLSDKLVQDPGEELCGSKTAEDLHDYNSVMNIISSEHKSSSRPMSSSIRDKYSDANSTVCDIPSSERWTRPRSSASSPEKNFKTGRTSSTYQPSKLSPQKRNSADQKLSYTAQSSPKKRIASSTLMSPNKRVAGSYECNHSTESSPVRCEDSYSPNRYQDEMDSCVANCLKERRVRFQNVSSSDECEKNQKPYRRNRTVSEGDSDISIESDITWPPRKWNHQQEEEVILYDHCGRVTSRYQPRHTVSLIQNQSGNDGMEEEMKACRERALRRHEETLRERRGCRAMYRQRLRAEFSCMISDLANLDKQTKLAKVDTDAKVALLPKKSKKKNEEDNTNKCAADAEKNDRPGNVRVTDCFSTDYTDIDTDKKVGAQLTREELTDCNLEALDQLLARLKEQRDHLLACQQADELSDEKESRNVQSTSVQCNGQSKVDIATSPRKTSPERVPAFQESHPEGKTSRGTSPINSKFQEPISERHDITSHDTRPRSTTPFLSAESSSATDNLQPSPKSSKFLIDGKITDKLSASKENSISQDHSKEGSPTIISNGSSSSVFVDATSYSFQDGKVEVKVTKKKDKRGEQRVTHKTDSKEKTQPKLSDDNMEITEIARSDSWARKLTENNSSTGTSYMSPPDELNPDEHKLLVNILEGMKIKNSNPILRMYIQKLLSMSKGSLENMSTSVSDDSVRSDLFKPYEGGVANAGKVNEISGKPCDSVETKEKSKKEKAVDTSDITDEKAVQGEVKYIFESDDGSAAIKESTSKVPDAAQSSEYTSATSSCSQYAEALKKYNDRLKILTKLMEQKVQPVRKSYSENDSSYLRIPSDFETSVKLTESAQHFVLPCPEASVTNEGNEDISPDVHPSDLSASSWGVRLNILPRPYTPQEDNIQCKRPKPPSTINNHTSRNLPETMAPHELSTIAEVDSKMLSLHPGMKSDLLDQFIVTGTNQREERKSDEESYHTLLPAGFVVSSSDSSFITSTSVSPVKPNNESSLQIYKELPDSSFGQSSAEEMAVSEVFRSLGIGWALSTWRKTHEASRKHQESSSTSNPSSDPANTSSKRKEGVKYRHSTPIKNSDMEKNQMVENEEDRLTPPSVTLYQRYQNLIKSDTSPPSCDS